MNNQEEYFEKNKKRLYDLLIHAKTNVDYYRNNWTFELPEYEDFDYSFFCKIPFLEKKVLRENSKAFLIDGINEDELLLDSTSGTEGKPIICYRNKSEGIGCANDLWRLRRRFVRNIRPSDRFARFYTFRFMDGYSDIVSDRVLYKDNDILLPLYNLSDEKLVEYWGELVKFKPRWLHGPSSTIYNLALVVEKNNLSGFRFELIELSGEYVDEDQKKYIEKVFQCPVADQYGCRECWPMAYTNVDGELEVVTDNIFIEQIYNEEYENNELVITVLKNKTWPLFRYKLEDIGEYHFDNDKVLLKIIRGRKADYFSMDEGKRFNTIMFSGMARAICEIYDKSAILQYQVIKKSDKDIEIYLRIHPEINQKELIAKYMDECKKTFGESININIIPVQYIKPDERTGKTKEFIDLSKN